MEEGSLREALFGPNWLQVPDSPRKRPACRSEETQGAAMFDSIRDFSDRLRRTGYFIDPVMTQVVFLAIKLHKPLLLEGPAGSGETQLPISIAEAAGTHVERLQCDRGVTEEKAIGRFDESLQRLYMEFSKGQHGIGRRFRRISKGARLLSPWS